MNADHLRDAIARDQRRVVEELKTLVRIPSIAFPGYDDKPVRASAEATATPKSGDVRLRPFVPRAEAEAAVRAGRLCRPRAERGSFAIVRRGRHIGVTLGPYLRGATPVRLGDTCPQTLGWAELVANER